MSVFERGKPRRVTKRYGTGSLLAVISLPVSWLMASRGMNGWQERAERDMEEGTISMRRQGYRVVSSEEHSVPSFGIYYWTVTYELTDQAV
jgi:hypothetical protein